MLVMRGPGTFRKWGHSIGSREGSGGSLEPHATAPV